MQGIRKMSTRKICVLTGTRAEFGLLHPVIEAISDHPDLEVQLLVTGMHLVEAFGLSVKDVERSGFPIAAKVPMHKEGDDNLSMALSVADGVKGISAVFTDLKPDVLVLLGDRTEVLAGAVAALYLNIPIAHIHGGDVTRGGTDESVRHAVTKMANIHFPATAKSADRIRKMGEDDWRIFNTGAPCLDTILSFDPLSREELSEQCKIPADQDFLLLVQHAVSTESELAVEQFRETLKAVEGIEMAKAIIYPNSDAGGLAIIEEIKKLKGKDNFYIFKSLPHQVYLSLMKHCRILVGNSSSGIIESSSFKIPVVNIGIRQEGRERAGNVLDVDHYAEEISSAIEKGLSEDFRWTLEEVENPYGNGGTGKKIAGILAEVELDKKLIQKKLSY